jgi:citrate synthase
LTFINTNTPSRTWTEIGADPAILQRRLELQKIYANVDAVTGLVYHPLGLPPGAFPLMFCVAIQVGWMAHCLEYLPEGPMIEPGSVYIDSGEDTA